MAKLPFTSKICPICMIDKPRSEYYKKLNTVSHKCKQCTLQDLKSRQDRYIGKYDDRQNEWRRTKYQNDAEYREQVSAYKKSLYEKNKEKINAKRRERWANDPYDPARKYNRRKDIKHRTPKWVDLNEILAVYANCPEGHHVDHIVPLRGIIDGRPVTGLHVAYNLQYLPIAENRKKYNRITEQTLLNLVK